MIKINPLVFLLFIIGVIMSIIMADTWGWLPKGQTDSQTIQEAIDQAIANHEADPEAHLGVGESLEQHKTNEVIDHPFGSVKNDKISAYNYYNDLKFSDYSLWTKYKNGVNYSFHQYLDGIYFETYPANAGDYNRLYKHNINFFPLGSSFYYSTNISSENYPMSSVYWSFGFLDSSLTIDKVCGFIYKNNKLYASLYKYVGDISYNYELVGIDIMDNIEHNLRLYYIESEKKYKWFIDGVLVYEYDNTLNNFSANFVNAGTGYDFKFTYDPEIDFIFYCYDPILSVDFTY